MFEKLEILLCLAAGLFALVAGILTDMDLASILIRLLITLVAAYVIGLIAKILLRKLVFFSLPEEELQAEEEDEGTQESEAQAREETTV